MGRKYKGEEKKKKKEAQLKQNKEKHKETNWAQVTPSDLNAWGGVLELSKGRKFKKSLVFVLLN